LIISITGGTGFIGRKLAMYHLARGDSVRILSRGDPKEPFPSASVKLYRGDLSIAADLMPFAEGADILYHCAGEIRDKDRMKSVHIDGTMSLIDAARGRIGRWVQLSSVGVYGKVRNGIVAEESRSNPIGIYEESKFQSDNLVTAAALSGAFEHVILRPSNVYGAEMTNQSMFQLITMIQRGLFFFIGKPESIASYIHVDNVVNALVLCGEKPIAKGQIYNLSDHVFLEQFILSIATELKVSKPKIRLPELPVRIAAKIFEIIPRFALTETRVDAMTGRAIYLSDKIKKDLGYRHIVSMEEGIRDVVESWKGSRR
jgi:nucleoside-diphosphate-sugar epimerase